MLRTSGWRRWRKRGCPPPHSCRGLCPSLRIWSRISSTGTSRRREQAWAPWPEESKGGGRGDRRRRRGEPQLASGNLHLEEVHLRSPGIVEGPDDLAVAGDPPDTTEC